jgi:hypothetical protein
VRNGLIGNLYDEGCLGIGKNISRFKIGKLQCFVFNGDVGSSVWGSYNIVRQRLFMVAEEPPDEWSPLDPFSIVVIIDSRRFRYVHHGHCA